MAYLVEQIVYVNKQWVERFQPASNDIVELLRLGVCISVVEEPPDNGLAYLGFYPEQLPEEVQQRALPLVGDEVHTFYQLLLHFAVGYIAAEVRAFKGEEPDIVSRMRVQ